ncbi:hypothetical protein [Bradyrhizobium sp. CCGUVB23]|uniref:hypothetical protein n=1 Tax=Bradyrhizobium sp. CCGUVB23 TaxID=2949630 RepID=UPI0020B40335|nr:hypothetical protein [Bradyrhizobium sp. CCGUVB23]MCP3460410.1 hypothetical protein [Bradyrhizobium sp. CCGUVB23]
MSDNEPPKPENTFASCLGLSREEIIDIEIAQCWRAHINTGWGEPYHFDYPTWLKMQERSR